MLNYYVFLIFKIAELLKNMAVLNIDISFLKNLLTNFARGGKIFIADGLCQYL